ncbi:hypothetical protein FGO68_gene12819 [Halteria grandinella]|uniref:Uncharacterized protein n=1 Tax=Halteria grandinella TaxID=5974 RepID=A0A8J8NZQ2_HALGN|nr:hypothetical protein FGO68_gene12819 [Halteria grandinella]
MPQQSLQSSFLRVSSLLNNPTKPPLLTLNTLQDRQSHDVSLVSDHLNFMPRKDHQIILKVSFFQSKADFQCLFQFYSVASFHSNFNSFIESISTGLRFQFFYIPTTFVVFVGKRSLVQIYPLQRFSSQDHRIHSLICVIAQIKFHYGSPYHRAFIFEQMKSLVVQRVLPLLQRQ